MPRSPRLVLAAVASLATTSALRARGATLPRMRRRATVGRAAGGAMSTPRMSVDTANIVVMMNGLPGKMGYSVAEACIARGMELADVALTGPEFAGVAVDTSRIPSVKLVAGGSPEADEAGADLAARCKAAGKTLVAIDFTAPVAALPNAEFYARHGMGFVMGTTGADAAALAATVDGGSHAAVIAPNMSKQIVALQAALERAAKDFPGAFSGYELSVVESHQKAKVDTSGTAKAVVASLVSLNDESVYSATDPKVTKAIENIELVRDDAAAASGMDGRLGKVPAEHLPGHAYHTYALTSGDGTVRFELRHNVNGRSTYAEGVADAVLFLASRLKEGPGPSGRRVFDMIDVLKAGAMS